GRAVEQQVDKVVGGEEDRIERLEHRPDDRQPDDDGQRAQVARADPVPEGPHRTAEALFMPHPFVAAIEQRRAHRPVIRRVAHGRASPDFPLCALRLLARRDTELLSAPVMALTSSWFEASGEKMPLFLPSRNTTIRSATASTSSILWLIMMTPRPRSRTRS